MRDEENNYAKIEKPSIILLLSINGERRRLTSNMDGFRGGERLPCRAGLLVLSCGLINIAGRLAEGG